MSLSKCADRGVHFCHMLGVVVNDTLHVHVVKNIKSLTSFVILFVSLLEPRSWSHDFTVDRNVTRLGPVVAVFHRLHDSLNRLHDSFSRLHDVLE